jgi:acyl CoA:acetate/3-ketoacid CoA transferase
VDGTGNVNVTRLKAQPHVLAGAGGFINIAMGTRKLVYCGTLMAGGLDIRMEDGHVRIVQDGRFQKFVEKTQDVTFNGRQGAEQGQEVWYVTERCVFRLTKDGLVLAEVASGVDLERDIRAKVGFPLQVAADCRAMDARIFRTEPMGLDADWT